MSAWTVIDHRNLSSSSAATIEFTSIPATFTDLCIWVSSRHTTGSVTENVSMRFNDVASGYTSRLLYNSGSGALTALDSGANRLQWQVSSPGGSSNANAFAVSTIYIPNYRGNHTKTVSTEAVTVNNTNGSAVRLDLTAGRWADNAVINKITLIAENGSFTQFSSATLYGITSGSSGGVTVS